MKFHHLAQPTLDEACRALFPTLSSSPCDAEASLSRAAIIGFSGDDVRGTLGVATSLPALTRVLEGSGAPEDPSRCQHTAAEDALGELANLILGFVKRAWLRREVHITLATPLVIRGRALEVCGGEVSHWVTAESESGGERISAWLDIHSSEELEVPDADSSKDIVAEGETLLF